MEFAALVALCLCAFIAVARGLTVEEQQDILEKIATNIRASGCYQNCQAPDIASCGTSTCNGSKCGNFATSFQVGFDSDQQIEALFVFCARFLCCFIVSLYLTCIKDLPAEVFLLTNLKVLCVCWPCACTR